MLSNKEKRHLHTKSRRVSSEFFDSGKQLKGTKSTSKGKQNNKKYSKKFIALILVLGIIYLSVNSFLKVNSYNENLFSIVNEVDQSCKVYKKNSSLNSFLNITLNDLNEPEQIQYWVYDENQIYNLNFNDTIFYIDKGYTKGNFKEYFQKNNVYLNQKKLFVNLSNLFLREFKLKVDHLVISKSNFDFDKYINDNKSNLGTKILKSETERKDINIETDICKDSWSNFMHDLQSKNKSTLSYDPKKKLTDYFFLGEIRKEQTRIHINNSTGVENWGEYMKALYENYGLNVVKVDVYNNIRPTSSVYIDQESLKDSATFKEITYLQSQDSQYNDIKTSIKNTIYSDIYIEVGQDWLSL